MQKTEQLQFMPMLETTVMVVNEAREIKEKYFFIIDNTKAYLHMNWYGPIERDGIECIFFY